MIKVRKNPFSSTEIEVSFVENETVDVLIKRALEKSGHDLNNPNTLLFFQVIFNGHKLEKDLWNATSIKIEDEVLIAPIIGGGSGGQLFKQILTIAAIVAISYYTMGTGAGAAGTTTWAGLEAGGMGMAMIGAVGSMAAIMAINAMIPPPLPPGLGGLGGIDSLEESQMYSVTSQSNEVKKYGGVPRVYGTHRIYPTVAALPYTDVEADPETGLLVQYFYCIYDFGYGPLDIKNVKIGETPFESYANADKRLVDPNKPSVSTGPWDDELHNSFEYYSGDNESDPTTVVLNVNESDANANVDDYRTIRTASSKTGLNGQQIILNFVAPQGLISYGTDGSQGAVNITMDIKFRKVGTNQWIPFNDTSYTWSDFLQISYGATQSKEYKTAIRLPRPTSSDDPHDYGSAYRSPLYTKLSSSKGYYDVNTYPSTNQNNRLSDDNFVVGYPVGQQTFIFGDGDAAVGNQIYIGKDRLLGVVASVGDLVPKENLVPQQDGFRYYTLTAPITSQVPVYWGRRYYVPSRTVSGHFISAKWEMSIKGSYLNTSERRYVSVGAVLISGKTTNPVYATFKFSPRSKGQYEVMVTRLGTTTDRKFQIIDKLSLISMTTKIFGPSVKTKQRHVFMEVKIRATNQLNGAIQNLNAVATSVLDVYNPSTSTWEKKLTNNPAWVYADLLTGTVNKKAISKSRLHTQSLVEWANHCDQIPTTPPGGVGGDPTNTFTEPRFQCNFILDYNTTLQQTLNSVSHAAQASLNMIDGKYGVLVDKLKTVPVQVFTPRNYKEFTSSLTYSIRPHALKVKYIEPNKDWELLEVIVYDDGYNFDGSGGKTMATEFEDMSSFACTSYDQAWRFGRYMIAQNKLRRENISIQVDFEHIVCTRGDFVLISSDVMKVGGRPARVKEITGPKRVKLDDAIETAPSINYGYTFRSVSGIYSSTLTVIDSDEFDLDGTMPNIGDLIIIREAEKKVYECLVTSITPSSDLTATLTLVEKADAVYLAESTSFIPAYDPGLERETDTKLFVPGPVLDLSIVENSWRIIGQGYEYFMKVVWKSPENTAVETYEVYVDKGQGYGFVAFTNEIFYEYKIDLRNLGDNHCYKVLAVNASGKKLNLSDATSVCATPARKDTPPSDVTAIYINITNETLTLNWDAIRDLDLKEYIIRYTPETKDTVWEATLPLLRVDRNTSSTTTQARAGTYFIKALDYNNRESYAAAQAVTSIPNLFNLNVITETNDFPSLPGGLDSTVSNASSLTLKETLSGGASTNEYYPTGYYYYSSLLDLGEIYTARLQSLIKAEGFTVGSLMSNWDNMFDLFSISPAGNAQWGVVAEVRGTNQFNVIAEWPDLDVIDPLSEGNQDEWTTWREFTIGDFTARIFEFRLKLSSYQPSVTPRVFDGVIRADMPDRIESGNNIIAPVEGITVPFIPPYKGPLPSPNIQITQDDMESGDYLVISDKSVNSFTIQFFDKDDNPVSRQFDWASKGYGRKAPATI